MNPPLRYDPPMTDDDSPTTPPPAAPPPDPDDDPVADLKKGVGLLFRAAKAAAQVAAHKAKDKVHADKVEEAFRGGVDDLQKALEKLPTEGIEGALRTSLHEMGRAFENVAKTLERDVVGRKPSDPAPPPDASHDAETPKPGEAEDDK